MSLPNYAFLLAWSQSFGDTCTRNLQNINTFADQYMHIWLQIYKFQSATSVYIHLSAATINDFEGQELDISIEMLQQIPFIELLSNVIMYPENMNSEFRLFYSIS